MDVKSEEFISVVRNLDDSSLFNLLDIVSDEVKRRNGLIGPDIPDIRKNSAEENVKLVLGALAGLGVKLSTKPTSQ